MEAFLNIAVNAPLEGALTYKHNSLVEPGSVVEVPLGKRKVKGVVFESSEEKKEQGSKFEIKNINSVHEELKVPLAHLKIHGIPHRGLSKHMDNGRQCFHHAHHAQRAR